LPALDIVHTLSGGFVRNKPIGCLSSNGPDVFTP